MSRDFDFSDLDELFTRVLDLPADERVDFLTQISSENPALASALERLLGRVARAESFLSADAERSRDSLLAQSLALVGSDPIATGLQPGESVGPYRIVERIGRGLRSVVYLARREEADWSQTVAIKVLARGVDTDDVYRRFLAERQILTQLRFPGISILLDGGVTEDGLPYFVMEYIDGLPITRHCEEQALGLEERVALFRQVCRAVAHAHRHLVVHRDIKPSNILVTRGGQVKLLDFGIAKLLETPADQAPYQTAADTRPMTPAYCSPEQESGESVTTATDVYQLGLLLAEILTGTGPARKVLGIEGHNLPASAPSRVTGAEQLPYATRELRGDLDWIVLRALEPAPENRYLSAADLLADIERYQDDQPVAARSWTVAYITRKFVRRRPGLALAACLGTVGLLGFAVLVGYFNLSLERERAAAIEAAAQAEETKDLLIQFLSSPDPYDGTGVDTRVSDLLDHSASAVRDRFSHRPELQAELLAALADVYQNLTVFDRAISLREEELRTRRGLGPSQDLPILAARRKLAVARLQSGAVEPALEELTAILAELRERHPEADLEIADTKSEIGSLLVSHGAVPDARQYLEEAIAVLREDGGQPISLAAALTSYAFVFEDYSIRLEHEQEAYHLRKEHQGPEHPSTLAVSAQIAATLTDMGRYEDSLERYRTLIPVLEREFGPMHSQTLAVLNNKAVTLYFARDFERAISVNENLLERRREKFGNLHPEVADSLQNLGALLVELERYEEAIPVLTEASEIYGEVYLPGSPVIAYPHISLAGIYSELDRPEQLEHHARRAIELLEGNVSETNVALLKSRCLLGDALIRHGRVAEGEPMVRAAVEGMSGQTRLSPTHIDQCLEILARASSGQASGSRQDASGDDPFISTVQRHRHRRQQLPRHAR